MSNYDAYDTWIRNPYYNKKLKNKAKRCSWSDELHVVIHRFRLGRCICNCGKVTITQKEVKGGWKRELVDHESENGK